MNNMKHKILMTLALLITAVTGAWAQDPDYDISVDFDRQYNPNSAHFNYTIMNLMDPFAEIKGTLELSVDGVSKGSFNVNGAYGGYGEISALNAGDHEWEAVFRPQGGGEFMGSGSFEIEKEDTYITYYGSTSINLGVGESTELDAYLGPPEAGELSYSSSDASVASITKKEYSYNTYVIQANAAGTATITFSFAGNTNYKAADNKTITVTVLPAPIKVTTNEAKTEASFEMPTFDVDVDYELVRDMSVQMQAQVGDDATKEPRYRVKWNDATEKFVPADMTQQQVAALFSVNDLVENTTLDPENYFVSIYAVNEQGETTGDPMTFLNFTFAPGRYCVTASAMLGSPTYDGTTALSNTFELFQGFEVQVAANSFATYYKDEALTIDESTAEDAALYTISEVTATEAVLSDEIEAAPKNTPLLIFNSSDKAKTIMLIPTNEPNLALTVAPEFKGTVTAKTFSEADMEAANFYVLTDANAFVWVKGAGQIAANKCWLQIEKTAPNNTRAIVFDNDATAISDISGESGLSGEWYDISGRKVSNSQQPKTKGLYINGGRKVVIK